MPQGGKGISDFDLCAKHHGRLCAKHHGRPAMRRRRPTEHIRVPLLCHQTNLPFTVVFMRSGRRVWFDHVKATAGRPDRRGENGEFSTSPSWRDGESPRRVLDLFPTLPWQGVRCPRCWETVA